MRFFYGWVIAGVAALTAFFSGPGQTFSVSMFVDPLIAEFGWSRTLVSSLYSAGTVTAGALMTPVGRLVDRHGYRKVLTAVVLLFAGACLWMSAVASPWMLLAGFLMIRTLGQGSMTLIPYSLVPQWFTRWRGRALAVTTMGGRVASAVFPYLNVVLIAAYGWRAGWQVWSACLVLLMAPVAWLLTRDRPEQLGLAPDGGLALTREQAAGVDPGKQAPVGGEAIHEEVSWTLGEAMQTRAFWVILLASSIPSMVGTGVTFHHASILSENGLPPAVAAGVFTVAALVAVPAALMAGWACDRWAARRLLVLGLAVQSVSVLWLLATTSPAAAVVLGAIRGMLQGLIMVLVGAIYPQYFGRRHLGSIRGAATTAMVIASALGPMPIGVAYDLFGGYREILLAMSALPAVGAAAALLLLDPPRGAAPGGG